MRAGRVLRQIIIARIEDRVPALAGKVFAHAAPNEAHPYAAMGPSDWVRDDAECFRSKTITQQIDIYHDAALKGALEDIVDDVSAALEGWEDTDRLTMHPLTVTFAQITDDPDGMSVHGILTVEAMVEELIDG